ncbi:tetratricopeptide repeat protein [Endozoicomonas ascidiicola]|uniref:tetratricopeptide repeat protein n=1 Tax=Endozoicomonas ascidiicola TaxID=1698521 RepID=UPI0012FC8E90|nr:hypothetical protein [Endozoicomonas ascidiicola]
MDFFHHLQDKAHSFIDDEQLTERLTARYHFLFSQFSDDTKKDDPHQKGWLEHEAVTFVLGDLLSSETFTADEYRALFLALMQARLSQVALTALNKAQSVMPADEVALKQGLVFQSMGDHEHSKESIEKACQLNPENHLAFFHYGFLLLLTGGVEQATAAFKTCTELAPDFVGGFQNLAGCYYQQSEFQLAVENCEKAYQIQADIPSSYITALSCNLAMGDLDNAAIWLERAREQGIDDLEIDRLHALYAAGREDHETAVELFSKYLDNTEPSLDILHFRGRSLAALGRWEALLETLPALLGVDPSDAWCLENLFLAHFHLQQWTEADQVMNSLLQMSEHYAHRFRDELQELNRNFAKPLSLVDSETC